MSIRMLLPWIVVIVLILDIKKNAVNSWEFNVIDHITTTENSTANNDSMPIVNSTIDNRYNVSDSAEISENESPSPQEKEEESTVGMIIGVVAVCLFGILLTILVILKRKRLHVLLCSVCHSHNEDTPSPEDVPMNL